MAQTVNIQINAQDNVTPVINNIRNNIIRLQRQGNMNLRGAYGGGNLTMRDVFRGNLGADLAARSLNTLAGAIANFARDTFETARRMSQMQKVMAYSTGGDLSGRYKANEVRGMANKYGLEYLSTQESFSKFAAATKEVGLNSEQTMKIFKGFSLSVAAFGLSAEKSKFVFKAVIDMLSKGTVGAEELKNQLGDHLPGAMALMAKAMGVKIPQLKKMMKEGLVDSVSAVMKMADLLTNKFEDVALKNIDTMEGKINLLTNAFTDLKSSIIDAFGPATMGGITKLTGFIKTLGDYMEPMFGKSEATREYESGIASPEGYAKTKTAKRIEQLKGMKDKSKALSGLQDLKNAFMTPMQIFDYFTGSGERSIYQAEEAGLFDPHVNYSEDLIKRYNVLMGKIRPVSGGRQVNRPEDLTPEELKEMEYLVGEVVKQRMLHSTKSNSKPELISTDNMKKVAVGASATLLGGAYGAGAAVAGTLSTEYREDIMDDKTKEIFGKMFLKDKVQEAINDILGVDTDPGDLTGGGKDKLKTDYHTPKVLNINILTGDGASLVNGGIQTDINTLEANTSDIRQNIKDILLAQLNDVVNDTATAVARVSKASGAF